MMLKSTINPIQIKMIVKDGSMPLGPPLSKKEGRLTIPTEVEKKDSKLDPYPWSSTFQDLTVRKGFFCEDKTRVLLVPMIFLGG